MSYRESGGYHTVAIDGKSYIVQPFTEWENDETHVVDCPITLRGKKVGEFDPWYADSNFCCPDRPPTEIEVKEMLHESGHRKLTPREAIEVEVFKGEQKLEAAERHLRWEQRLVKEAEDFIPNAVKEAEADLERKRRSLANYEKKRDDTKAALEAARAKLKPAAASA